jgi:hypothetical protein
MSDDSQDGSTPPTANTGYIGIVESLATWLFIADSDPQAERKRAVVHWITVGATVVFAVGFAALIVIMFVAVVQG